MIKSMTGYGRAHEIVDGRDILVEIRSVNHRYNEFSSRVPRAYGYLDEKLKTLLQESVSRGKVEVSVLINNLDGKDALIEVNKSIAHGYISALRKVNEELNLNDDLNLSILSRFSDIFNVTKTVEDEEEIWNSVKQVAVLAFKSFIDMREREGSKLKEDLINRLAKIKVSVKSIEDFMPTISENYRSRLYNKIAEILEERTIEEQRILTEVAIFSEKIAVDEETVRLYSHLEQFNDLLNESNPIGRKLDFLVQEINREVNTIGSKAQGLDVTKIVIDLKSELEKIREQIQNIE
jgi:uncharacterized protein (TIGR00255 family)